MPEKQGIELLLGQVAVRQRLITPEQLEKCLTEQEAEARGGGRPTALGTLLVRHGYLTDAGLREVLAAQRGAPPAPPGQEARAADALFGRRLVSHALVTNDQLNEALRIQGRLRDLGVPLRLGEILIARGVLTPRQVRDGLALQDKTLLRCGQCGKAYNARNHRPGRTLPCPNCRAPLMAAAPDAATAADDSHWGGADEPGAAPAGPPPGPKPPGAISPPEPSPLAATVRALRDGPEVGLDAPARFALTVRNPGAPTARVPVDSTATRGSSDECGGSPPPAEARAAPAGEPFGRYRLLQELGRGGMGVVYKAWDGELRRVVALKTLLAEAGASEQDVERFQREARSAAALRHPGIVQVYDVGMHAGRHFFTMDYIEGESLEAALPALPPRRFLEILREVAVALDAAHRAGVVHRDVKPANVLLDGAGRPYVGDFGLAKEFRGERKGGMTASGAVLGTPHYLSPEQARGRIGAIGPATDVWGLGVMLYRHLTGTLPFQGSSLVEILLAVAEREPPAPSRVAAAAGRSRRSPRRVHRDLETICLKCLEKSPARRYGTAAELAEEIGRYLDGEPIAARPVSGLERLARRAAKRKVVTALLGALVLTAAGGVAALLTTVRRWESQVRDIRGHELYRRAEAMLEAGLLAQRHGETGPLEERVPRLRETAEQALREDPACLEAHFVQGWIYQLENRWPEAVAEYAAYLQGRPDDAIARYRRGTSYLALASQEWAEARTEWQDLQRPIGAAGASPAGTEVPVPSSEDLERLRPRIRENFALGEKDLAALSPESLNEKLLVAAASGHLCFARGDFAGAIAAYRAVMEEARERTPPEVLTGFAQATLYLHLEQDKRLEAQAIEVVLAAVAQVERLNRGLETTHLIRSQLRNALAQAGAAEKALALWEEAERDATTAIDLWPRGSEEHVCRCSVRAAWGRALAELGRGTAKGKLEEALADGDEAVRRAESRGGPQGEYVRRAREARAGARRVLGDWQADHGEDPVRLLEGAVADCDFALEGKAPGVSPLRLRAQVRMLLGDWKAGRGEDPEIDYSAALADTEAALERDPSWDRSDHSTMLLTLAHWKAKRGEDPTTLLRNAIAEYDAVLERNPEDQVARGNRGLACVDLGQRRQDHGEDPTDLYDAAIADFDFVLAKHPGDVTAYCNRSCVRTYLAFWKAARREDPTALYEGAIADCGAALAADPGRVVVLQNRAMARRGLGEWLAIQGKDPTALYQGAIADCGAKLALRPQDLNVHLERGNVRQSLGQWRAARGEDPTSLFEGAVSDFDAMLARDPSQFLPYYNRANARRLLGMWKASRGEDPAAHWERAITDYGEALARNPQYRAAHGNRFLTRTRFGEWKAARGEDPTVLYEGAIADCVALAQGPDEWKWHADAGVAHGLAASWLEAQAAGAGGATPELRREWLSRAAEHRRAAVAALERTCALRQDPKLATQLEEARAKLHR